MDSLCRIAIGTAPDLLGSDRADDAGRGSLGVKRCVYRTTLGVRRDDRGVEPNGCRRQHDVLLERGARAKQQAGHRFRLVAEESHLERDRARRYVRNR